MDTVNNSGYTDPMDTYRFVTHLSNTLPQMLVNNNVVPNSTYTPPSTDKQHQFKGKMPKMSSSQCKRKIEFNRGGATIKEDPLLSDSTVNSRNNTCSENPPRKNTQKRNERERNRVKTINQHFSTLRQHVPHPLNMSGKVKKLSKVEILKAAMDYIYDLKDILEDIDSNAKKITSPVSGTGSSENFLNLFSPVVVKKEPKQSETTHCNKNKNMVAKSEVRLNSDLKQCAFQEPLHIKTENSNAHGNSLTKMSSCVFQEMDMKTRLSPQTATSPSNSVTGEYSPNGIYHQNFNKAAVMNNLNNRYSPNNNSCAVTGSQFQKLYHSTSISPNNNSNLSTSSSSLSSPSTISSSECMYSPNNSTYGTSTTIGHSLSPAFSFKGVDSSSPVCGAPVYNSLENSLSSPYSTASSPKDSSCSLDEREANGPLDDVLSLEDDLLYSFLCQSS